MKYRFLFLYLFCLPWLVCNADDATSPALTTLQTRLEGLQTRLDKHEIPADPQNLGLLKFKLDQARLWLKGLDSNEVPYLLSSPYDESKEKTEKALERAESIARTRGDAVYPTTSQLHERAYIADNDGSAQPYWVFLPKDYSARQKWPVVVFLHGYSPTISKIEPWVPSADTWMQFTSRGFILVIPYGRRNSDFVQIGEDDTLKALRETNEHYSTDPDRTFLLGPSMGGYGVYAVGLHNPDIFGALTPMCARTDMYLWFKLNRDDVPAWKQINYDADDPRSLARNSRQLPIFLQHGSADQIVSVENSRLFFEDAKKLKLPAFYRELPYASHYIYWDDTVYTIALDWLKKLKKAPVPARVEYLTGSLRTNRSYWVAIDGFEDYSKLAHIDAEVGKNNAITITTENVRRFSVTPPATFFAKNVPITLTVNGTPVPGKYTPGQTIRWPGLPETATPHKTNVVCGPIKECYRDPFLLVYGTHPRKTELTHNLDLPSDEVQARRFQKEWDDFADGVPPLKPDIAVTDADKKKYNLILFGTRETNSLLDEIGDILPLEMTPDGYRVGDKKYPPPGKRFGLQFCYRSPFDPQRKIVVQSGLFWGTALPVNHKLDLLPEYIVYLDRLDFTDSTNLAALAGFFDDNWKLPADVKPFDLPPVLEVPEEAEPAIPPEETTDNGAATPTAGAPENEANPPAEPENPPYIAP